MPRPLVYFVEVAKLFPHAVPLITEYRAEAYSCEERVWRELDVRPFFPLRADDKENRFDRAMFFFRREPTVMRALDEYLVASKNTRDPSPIGGVLLLSLRIPIPPPGGVTERYQRKPLPDYPAAYRKYWYRTPTAEVADRCNQQPRDQKLRDQPPRGLELRDQELGKRGPATP